MGHLLRALEPFYFILFYFINTDSYSPTVYKYLWSKLEYYSMKYSLINYLKPTVGIRLNGCIMESNKITRVVLEGFITNSQLVKMLANVSNDVNVNIYTETQLKTEQATDQYINSQIEYNIEPLDQKFNYFLTDMSQDLRIDLDQIMEWVNSNNIRSILEIRSAILHNSPLLSDLPEKVLTYLKHRFIGE